MLRQRFLFLLTFAALLWPGSPAEAQRTTGAAVSLAQAIADFNAKAQQSETGRQQSPLTMEEVIAAVGLRGRREEPSAPERQWQQFKQVAETRMLPPAAEFEVLTGIDPGGAYIYEVWYVRLMLRKDDGGTYSFTIRERAIRARHVSEIVSDLEKVLKDSMPYPGRYRIEDRLKEMKRRLSSARPATSPATSP